MEGRIRNDGETKIRNGGEEGIMECVQGEMRTEDEREK